MLASTGVGDQLRREIVVDPAHITFDRSWFNNQSSSLIFLLLLPVHAESGGALIQSIKKEQPDVPIIVVVDELGPVDTLELLRKGASDLITPPLKVSDTLPRVWRLLEQLERRTSTIRNLMERVGLKSLVGQSPNFLAEIKKIPLIARCDSRVLICCATGTRTER